MCSRDPLYSAGKLIERHEGRRSHVYHDTEGHPTIGIGFNLDREDAALALFRVGAYHGELVSGRADLNDAQIDALFARDLADSTDAARECCPGFDSLPIGAQLALVDIAFNLGRAGLAGFKVMLLALEVRDFPAAAVAAFDSVWARQVGDRAVEDAALLRGDEVPGV
jgi:GH24 family phage-related lysozyme (muramidase)